MIVITVARKPIEGSVASNVALYGCGGVNVDGARITFSEMESPPSVARRQAAAKTGKAGDSSSGRSYQESTRLGKFQVNPEVEKALFYYLADRPGEKQGRWPANFILQHSEVCKGTKEEDCKGACADTCPVLNLAESSGFRPAGVAVQRNGGGQKIGAGNGIYHGSALVRPDTGYEDTGSAARFFKQVK